MGIKFNCPNGHKMNVKTFLAGKKGICPTCGVRVTIPQPGFPGSTHEQDEPSQGADQVPSIDLVFPVPEPVRTMVSAPTAPPESASAIADSSSIRPAETGGRDPLLELPWAQWYVIIPSGERFGPAPAEVMRQWIAAGRVSADCLVWRDGWGDWQRADIVFAQLRSSEPVEPQNDFELRPSQPAIRAPVDTVALKVTRSRSKQGMKSASAFLLLLVVALGVLLVVVLWAPWRKRSEQPKSSVTPYWTEKDLISSWHQPIQTAKIDL